MIFFFSCWHFGFNHHVSLCSVIKFSGLGCPRTQECPSYWNFPLPVPLAPLPPSPPRKTSLKSGGLWAHIPILAANRRQLPCALSRRQPFAGPRGGRCWAAPWGRASLQARWAVREWEPLLLSKARLRVTSGCDVLVWDCLEDPTFQNQNLLVPVSNITLLKGYRFDSWTWKTVPEIRNH